MKATLLPYFRAGFVALVLGWGWPAHAADPAGNPQDRAVSALEADIKADPSNAELWIHLGFANRKLGKIDDAQAAFEKATALSSTSKDAFFMLGLIYESKNMKPQAVKAWQSYMALETDHERRDMAEKHIHHVSQ